MFKKLAITGLLSLMVFAGTAKAAWALACPPGYSPCTVVLIMPDGKQYRYPACCGGEANN